MIRILMVVHEMNRGGIENFIMNLYRTVDNNKIQFDFVVHTKEKCAFDEEINELGGMIYHCPDYRVVNHFQYIAWWNKFFSEHKEYKIVHSHLDSSANVHLRIAKKHNRIAIAHSHSASEGFGIKAIVKSVLKLNFNSCCDYKFACSKEAARWLFGKNIEDVTVIKNGIQSNNYIFDNDVRKERRLELGISDDKIVLGHVGRVDKNKNQDFIIDILASLKKINENVLFISVGRCENNEDLLSKIKNLKLSDNVVFLGLRDDVNEILQTFDMFVFPSIYEGLGISVIEAQASGLKCLLSDTITKEVDITGNVEFMSLEKSPKEWAEKIVSMFPYERKNTQQKIIDAGYDIKSTAEWLTDFYIKLAEKNS